MTLFKVQRNQSVEVLDGLRGLAIFLVVWFHIWQISWLSTRVQTPLGALDLDFIGRSGFLGVELFFFVSAVCLALPVFRAEKAGVSPSWSHYAYRRAIKILPSYWLAILLVLLLKIEVFNSLKDLLWHVITHLFFVHNWFRETRNSILGVFWSLGVEVQFYFCFPWIVQTFRKSPLGSLLGTILVSSLYRYGVVIFHPHDLDFWVNLLPGFLDLFGFGIFAAACIVAPENFSGRYFRFLAAQRAWSVLAGISLLGVMGLAYSVDQVRYEPDQPYLWLSQHRQWVGFAILGLTLSLHFASARIKKWVLRPSWVGLSMISYNLYIWHQVIGRQLVKWNIPQPMTPDPHDDGRWKLGVTCLALTLSLAFAALITFGFERPLLQRKVPLTRP
jgi:peptidoglycan/LPS O-acetylase OafA/YrhL